MKSKGGSCEGKNNNTCTHVDLHMYILEYVLVCTHVIASFIIIINLLVVARKWQMRVPVA
jgi:hypothetical protein